jgi:hypothetical protein
MLLNSSIAARVQAGIFNVEREAARSAASVPGPTLSPSDERIIGGSVLNHLARDFIGR